ncbi:LysR substrate-binding domain-containing protein [Hyphomicrobium sp. NDB2Meth4]|uniref:LysR substrate-binding domain-containing protein n=1 Tax=Hyphomicrobium sp. NDB2Meth4 TaxID=1892846 RepID=UPI0009315A60|nr:LysR substrate-binding domain-containing protein [Hyphomicrobium sp. NDB2Meth4]
MTLEQLRIFVAVAERQHVTRAAEAINITQSAASAAIAALEGRYGVALFDRIGRRIALTKAGEEFLPEARAVLARATAAERTLTDLAGIKRGALTLYASQTITNYWLPQFIARFRARYPGITLNVIAGNTQQVASATREGLADLGFVEGAIDDPQLSGEVVATDRMIAVFAKADPLARKSKLSVADLKKTRWVLREQGSGTRAEFKLALQRLGISPADLDIALELPSNEAVLAAVAAGAGATVVSALVADAGLRLGELATPKEPLSERTFQVLRHRERHVSRAEAAFLALIPDRKPKP